MNNFKKIGLAGVLAFLVGCTQEIPPAHKGRLFDKTGFAAFYSGGVGFKGPTLGPGTHWVGWYPEIRMVECGQRTVKESLTALTKDGVQFSLDVYISFGAACDQEQVIFTVLEKLAPEGTRPPADPKSTDASTHSVADPERTVTADQIYRVYIRPAMGEAVRESISPYIANDVNSKREEIFDKIKTAFADNLAKQKPQLVTIYSLNLSNLDFPDAMDNANTERAVQAILKDKAIAQQEKIKAEIETARLEITKREVEAQAEAKKIDTIGAALHRNPEYYIRDVYYYAADKGGSVMVPQNPNYILQITPSKKQ